MGSVRGVVPGGVGTRAAGVGLALAFAALAGGCDGDGPGGYDPALRYPPRTDPLVLAAPPAAPAGPAPAGRLDESIAAFPSAGGRLLDPNAVPVGKRRELAVALEELFGTPAAPLAGPAAELGGLDLSPAHLAAGSRVYRRLCGQCHGLAGDGRGPTGPWVYPHPRDFRPGLFKATAGGPKPRVETLARQVRRGVPGTAMQPYDLIPEEEVRAAVAYVVHLSLRGEVEFRVTKALLDETGDSDVTDVAAECRAAFARCFDQWAKAQAEPEPPAPPLPEEPSDPAYQEAVRRGQRLFAEQSCASCHQDYGRAAAYRYDAWGGAVRVPDLTRGEFKWGKQPADLAARVRHGVPPSGMPANGHLTDAQVADLALFVRELPYPGRLPPDVRDRVYPPAGR
jgi:mono/diheme cytochrome c family protein